MHLSLRLILEGDTVRCPAFPTGSLESRHSRDALPRGSRQRLFGIPHNATTVLKINPETDEVSLIEGSNGTLPEGKWKWHGGLVAGHKIIGFPNNSDEVLIVDCKRIKVYTIGGSLQSGRHRIPQDGRYKWLGGALSMNKRYAYLFPCDAERVLRVDCETDELRPTYQFHQYQ